MRVSNDGAIRLYERLGFEARGIRRGYYTDNREDALIMWREPRRPTADVILALETSCDETAARSSRTTGEIRANVVVVAGRAARALRRRRAGGRVAAAPRARRRPVVREALDEAGASLDDVDTRRGHARARG